MIVAGQHGGTMMPRTPSKLPVASGGVFPGRFLMTLDRGGCFSPEQRLLGIALAGQVGAALGTSHAVDQR
jgi:hypothetical protein